MRPNTSSWSLLVAMTHIEDRTYNFGFSGQRVLHRHNAEIVVSKIKDIFALVAQLKPARASHDTMAASRNEDRKVPGSDPSSSDSHCGKLIFLKLTPMLLVSPVSVHCDLVG